METVPGRSPQGPGLTGQIDFKQGGTLEGAALFFARRILVDVAAAAPALTRNGVHAAEHPLVCRRDLEAG
jgi:hypothetical protein